ncbi:MAG: ATP phosphoribosyltransferase [Fibrobacteraceae bacterium]|jgi:ATP phosphoribosyltransferase|nr:ATP phosphoribosyltransferase [Fibrobacteraceae bacterium]MBQ5610696.1 ATP phosphoribosyltransferase [Fibrobacteraceae bacterium]MEE1275370.1 ATP phosphoribosyltransferase [Fibrobacteraceae bacterium]
MIKVALPNKGMLFEPTQELLKACGYKASKPYKTLTQIDSKNGIEFFFLRPSDIPMYVGRGIIDAGITGMDFNAEAKSPAVKVLDLPFGASKMCAAVPENSPVQTLEDLKTATIATSFPNIVNTFYQKEMDTVVLEGAVEISVSLGVADAVVDVVETGTTLKQAGLRILGEPLFRSNAALFCHPQKQDLEEVHTLVRRIEGKLVAQSYMMIEYDVPSELLSKACELTPGLDAPTISKLHGRDWYAVKAMVSQEEANGIMDQLWKIGCRSILLFAIKSARI